MYVVPFIEIGSSTNVCGTCHIEPKMFTITFGTAVVRYKNPTDVMYIMGQKKEKNMWRNKA